MGLSNVETVIKKKIVSELRNLDRSCPAIVKGVQNLSKGFIDVQPLVNKVNSLDGNTTEYPLIRNVRVIFPSTKTSTFCFPVSQEDEVLLVFQSSNIEKFVQGNTSPHSPTFDSYNNLSDVVAYVGFQPYQKSCFDSNNYTNDFSSDDLNIVHNKNTPREVTLTLTQDGDFKVITTGKVVLENVIELDCGEALIKTNNDVLIKGKSVEQFTLLHDHGGVQSGNSKTLPPNPL